jgi:hypothetical protein
LSADSAIKKMSTIANTTERKVHKMTKRASDASSNLTKCAPEAKVKRDALPRFTNGGHVGRLSDPKKRLRTQTRPNANA